jgi:hypothetical protein
MAIAAQTPLTRAVPTSDSMMIDLLVAVDRSFSAHSGGSPGTVSDEMTTKRSASDTLYICIMMHEHDDWGEENFFMMANALTILIMAIIVAGWN